MLPFDRRETGVLVGLPEKLCSHRMLEEVGQRSDIDLPPGKPLQSIHRQQITELLIQPFSSYSTASPVCPKWIGDDSQKT